MKAVKWIAIPAVVYVGIVVLFETRIVVGQPTGESWDAPMLVITTTDESGESHDRRLAQLWSDGRLYVSAHHWPRGWHRRAVENPEVRVAFDEAVGDYTAIPVEGEEYARVHAEHPLPLPVRILMGFPPPRDLLRLDPRSPTEGYPEDTGADWWDLQAKARQER